MLNTIKLSCTYTILFLLATLKSNKTKIIENNWKNYLVL